jgi:hypothetical protein
MTGDRVRLGMFGALLLTSVWHPQTHAAMRSVAAAAQPDVQLRHGGADVRLCGGTLSLRLLGTVLRVHFIPRAGATPPTLVMAPHATGPAADESVVASRQRGDLLLSEGRLRVALDEPSGTLTVFTAGAQRPLLRLSRLASLARGTVMLRFAGARRSSVLAAPTRSIRSPRNSCCVPAGMSLRPARRAMPAHRSCGAPRALGCWWTAREPPSIWLGAVCAF